MIEYSECLRTEFKYASLRIFVIVSLIFIFWINCVQPLTKAFSSRYIQFEANFKFFSSSGATPVEWLTSKIVKSEFCWCIFLFIKYLLLKIVRKTSAFILLSNYSFSFTTLTYRMKSYCITNIKKYSLLLVQLISQYAVFHWSGYYIHNTIFVKIDTSYSDWFLS